MLGAISTRKLRSSVKLNAGSPSTQNDDATGIVNDKRKMNVRVILIFNYLVKYRHHKNCI